MHKYWFSLGAYEQGTYGTILVLAFFLSMGVAVFMARSAGRKDLTVPIVDMSLFSIFGGLIGARLWHVFVFNWSYYSEHLSEIYKVWHGGLSIQGGLIGGFLVAIFYCYRKKVSFWLMADVCAPALIFGQGIGRYANLLNGDGLASPTGGDFGVVYPPGTNAYAQYQDQPLWPAETWEGQIDIVIFALLLIFRLRKWPSGFIFLFYVLMYSMNRFGMEYLRGDTPQVGPLTAAQWTAVALAALALVFLLVRHKAPKVLGFGIQPDNDPDKGPDSDKGAGKGKDKDKGKDKGKGKDEGKGKDKDNGDGKGKDNGDGDGEISTDKGLGKDSGKSSSSDDGSPDVAGNLGAAVTSAGFVPGEPLPKDILPKESSFKTEDVLVKKDLTMTEEDLRAAGWIEVRSEETTTATTIVPIAEDALKRESLKQDAMRHEAQKQEILKQDALKKEVLSQEALKQEALKQEAQRQEAQKQEALKQEAQKQEALKQEAQKQDESVRKKWELVGQDGRNGESVEFNQGEPMHRNPVSGRTAYVNESTVGGSNESVSNPKDPIGKPMETPMPIEIPPHVDIPVLKDSFHNS